MPAPTVAPNAREAVAEIRAFAHSHALALSETETGGAVFSPCNRWRYLLWRVDNPRGGLLGMGMLNPSTADAACDDPTIRRCRAQAKRLRMSGLLVWNLFAWRATMPADLKRADDAVGVHNDAAIAIALGVTRRTVLGWGMHGSHRGRDREILRLCFAVGCRIHALGFTKSGAPRHPLYLPVDRRCRPFTRAS